VNLHRHRLANPRRLGIARRAGHAALLVAASAALGLGGCVYAPQASLPDLAGLSPAQSRTRNARVFDAVADLVRRGYYSDKFNGVDWTAACKEKRPAALAATTDADLYAVINELLAELKDDHTHALTPDESTEMDRARRVLLGLILRPQEKGDDNGPMVVMETIPGSTAAASPIQPGWVLVSCDDRPPHEVLGRGKLHEGQMVRCGFLDRDHTPQTVMLTARQISVQPQKISRVLADGILYLRFDKFDSDSARWLRSQLKEHDSAPGLILDLRQNPGGDAAALGRMLGEFFSEKVNMGTFITRRGFNDHLHAWRWIGSAHYTGPLVVLVSPISASSAEIFAAVMQYHHRALIFGETTDGAVLASRFFPLPGGGRLQLAIDNYLAPDGARLEGKGVVPDRTFPETVADLQAGRDSALSAAVSALRTEAPAPVH
jgi:carboxyl-terminal processing protease